MAYGEFTECAAEVLCLLDGFEFGPGDVAAEVRGWVVVSA